LLALLVALLTIRLVVPPRNQFEITHPFTASAPEPLLYVTLVTGKTSVPKHFDTVKKLETQSFPSEGARCAMDVSIFCGVTKSDHDH
jgi:hypothetical protein